MAQPRQLMRGALHVLAGGPLLAPCLLLGVPASRLRRALRRRRGALPRILWAPVPIVNIAYSAQADRLRGYESETLVYGVYRITARDRFDHVLDGPMSVPLLRHLVPYATLAWALLRFDVFGFFFDGGLLHATPAWRLELPLLRLAGKRIVVYPYGDDARLPSRVRARGGWHQFVDVPPGAEDRDERATLRRLAAFGRNADAILGCADLHEDLPRVDGIFRYPFDASAWTPTTEVDDGVVTVVHAPNHRHIKGTRFLVAAVEQLQGEGVAIELDLVEGLPNDEARERYRRADIVVDQLLVGAYALFAIEGMALGKPVICRLDDRHRAVHPEWEECPVVSADPDTVTGELRRLAQDAGLRRELGARGPGYVQRWHSLESVGAELDTLYRRLWR